MNPPSSFTPQSYVFTCYGAAVPSEMSCSAEDVERIYVIGRSKTVEIFPQAPFKLHAKHAILNYKVPAATVTDEHHWLTGETPPPCNTCY